MRTFNVFVSHDTAENLWFVESSDIPGLNVEASSYEQLVEIVLDAAPDLIDCNIDERADDLPSIPVSIQQVALIKRIHHA